MFTGKSKSNQGTNSKVIAAAIALVTVLSALLWPMTANAAPAANPDDEMLALRDALTPPDAEARALSLQGALTVIAPNAPAYYETSEYFIGHVAVGLILPESNGEQEAQSEDWTDEEIAKVQDEVQDALAWWAELEPAANLSFTVETHTGVSIGYEPITHDLSESKYWIGATMAALGYENDSYFTAVRDYVNGLRDRTGSDWAFAIIVADSSADDDGRFPDNYFDYAYLGGPFVVLTYDNGGYGISAMEAVVAHEIGHIFRALDQYAGAGVDCEDRSGVLNVENGNSKAGSHCESNQPSIMRGGTFPYNARAIDYYARGQLGWWDSDGDGILDPVDPDPDTPQQPEQPEDPTGFTIFIPMVQRHTS